MELNKEFLDALAPRRDCSRGRSQQAGWELSTACWTIQLGSQKLSSCALHITSTSVAS